MKTQTAYSRGLVSSWDGLWIDPYLTSGPALLGTILLQCPSLDRSQNTEGGNHITFYRGRNWGWKNISTLPSLEGIGIGFIVGKSRYKLCETTKVRRSTNCGGQDNKNTQFSLCGEEARRKRGRNGEQIDHPNNSVAGLKEKLWLFKLEGVFYLIYKQYK